jgi:hypothetical protein
MREIISEERRLEYRKEGNIYIRVTSKATAALAAVSFIQCLKA